MAKGSKLKCKPSSKFLKATSNRVASCWRKDCKDAGKKNCCSRTSGKKDWEDATCSVCMEVPHNAVLLLCSSYHKGCRPYMCATSNRYSNCLDQYKNAYTKVTSIQALQSTTDGSVSSLGLGEPNDKMEVPELLCPLCRGQVKGWTVVEPAREYLNSKKRTCMQDDCSFVGTYKELKKHVKAKHPFARPREVDPKLEEKWKMLECERERNDVITTIISSTPGALVLGDYVIEPNYHEFYSNFNFDGNSLENHFFNIRENARLLSRSRYNRDHRYDSFGRNDFDVHRGAPASTTAVPGRVVHRSLFGRSRRRRRHRQPNEGR